MDFKKAVNYVMLEYLRAQKLHQPFNSPHEGYAVIKEELDELWEAIRKARNFQDRNDGMKKEARQVAAMALRFLVDLIGDS